jgi:hypothetical protein
MSAGPGFKRGWWGEPTTKGGLPHGRTGRGRQVDPAGVAGREPAGAGGIDERDKYVAALTRTGADRDAARFALLPPDGPLFAAWTNRNLLALHAAGRVLLQLDDDCSP